MKWIGAVMIILGCGGFGFTIAANHRTAENTLRQLTAALDYMECELRYRMTPLPQLCREAASERTGPVRSVFSRLAEELDAQVTPEVSSCMNAALSAAGAVPGHARSVFLGLGQTLGRFDLDGQLKGLEQARQQCRRELDGLSQNRDVRLRSYQTLGLCAGAALAILFL